MSNCKVQIFFHVKTDDDDDDDDTKDVLLAKEEYYMRMLSTLYPFGLNDNVKSLNINLKTYDFTQFHCLNTPFFSYTQPREKRSHGHRKNNSQTALEYTDFISKINELYITWEHRMLYTLLRSVSHQFFLKYNISYCLREQDYTFRGISNYSCFVFTILWAEKHISKHIVYFTLPFVHKLQEDVNLNRILNC